MAAGRFAGTCAIAAAVALDSGCTAVLGMPATHFAIVGPPGSGPRCGGLKPTCGATGAEDCCATANLPQGTFARSYDASSDYNDKEFTATVSRFALDVYEVTVARFRSFVVAYPGSKPAPGSGANPNDPQDEGWDGTWDSSLSRDQAALAQQLDSCGYGTWSGVAGTDDDKAINCVTWFEAFAFCVWDGGRLPTEAEWNYSAAGGGQQRAYPWGSASPGGNAVFGGAASVAAVGSKSPAGDGRWGHADLAGNVDEWTLDWFAPYAATNPCADCAFLAAGAGVTQRVARGGDFYDDETLLRAARRLSWVPSSRDARLGFRCARDPQ